MRRRATSWVLPAAGLVLLAAAGVSCAGDGSVSPFLREPTGADQMAGSWMLHLPPVPECSPGLPAIDLILDLERTWPAGQIDDSDREFLIGGWRESDEAQSGHMLQGWIEPELRRLHLILWQGVHQRGSVLSAKVIAGRVIDGRLVEPVPPYPEGGFARPSEGYPGGFSDESCAWDVRGERIGS